MTSNKNTNTRGAELREDMIRSQEKGEQFRTQMDRGKGMA